MKTLVMVSGVLFLAAIHQPASGQISIHPFHESFDATDMVPDGWSVTGFELSTSVPHSSPHCLLVRGNMAVHTVATPSIDLGGMTLRAIRWYERRSGSAAQFALHVYFQSETERTLLVRFDSIPTANSYQERSVGIPDSLLSPSGQGRFVLEVQADSMNSSGVLRIDDVRLEADPNADLSVTVSPPALSPLFVDEQGDILMTIRNLRQTPAEAATLEISHLNEGLPSPGTPRIVPLPRIAPGDSFHYSHTIIVSVFGAQSVYAWLKWPDDQDASNDTASVSFPAGYAPGSVVITEFMYAPLQEDEPEWIEIFNPGPGIVNGLHLTMSDKGTQRTEISSSELMIVPGAYAVVAASATLGEVYAMEGIRWTVARFSALNNTSPDAVVLRDRFGTTMDSVAYDPMWGQAGSSLERRDWLLPSLTADTWQSSTAAGGGTPGRVNSVQRDAINGTVHDLRVVWDENEALVRSAVRVKNTGRGILDESTVVFRVSPPSASGTSGRIGSIPVRPLEPDESLDVVLEWVSVYEGRLTMQAQLEAAGDMNHFDDTARAIVDVPYAAGSVVVNEIMFDPLPAESEWIEVLNTRDIAIPMEGWTVSDLPTASGQRTRISLDSTALIPPNGLVVIAGDSSLFLRFPWLREEPFRSMVVILDRSNGLGLNGSRDGVVLADQTGRTIDSVLYDADWHNPSVDAEGRSLERLRTDLSGAERRAWSSAPGRVGASPGLPNGALPPERQTASGLLIAPNPFSPDGDGHEDIAFISYAYPTPSVFVKALIFDDRGRGIRNLANGGLFSGRDMIAWDGLDDGGRRVRRGPYILLLEAWNAEHSYAVREKRVVVVAR